MWVDYAELSCLFSRDGQAGPETLFNRGRAGANDVSADLLEDDDEDSLLATRGRSDEGREALEVRIERLWPSILSQVHMRQKLSAGAYPFEIKDDLIICAENTDSNTGARLYKFLLQAANSSLLVNADDRDRVRKDFEKLARCALRRVLPERWAVIHCGVGSGGEHGFPDRRDGSFRSLVESLAAMLNGGLQDPERFGARANGDGGLDLIAAFRDIHGDPACSPIVFLGQCACGWDQLRSKQHEVAYGGRWSSIISLKPKSLGILFLPHFARRHDGRFVDELSLVFSDEVAWFDRPRLLGMLLDESLGAHDWLQIVDGWFNNSTLDQAAA
ncbi:MAG: hypothetical protein RLY86_1941 [Pseudomonadota bacterium]|jgi:hypothetical protein